MLGMIRFQGRMVAQATETQSRQVASSSRPNCSTVLVDVRNAACYTLPQRRHLRQRRRGDHGTADWATRVAAALPGPVTTSAVLDAGSGRLTVTITWLGKDSGELRRWRTSPMCALIRHPCSDCGAPARSVAQRTDPAAPARRRRLRAASGLIAARSAACRSSRSWSASSSRCWSGWPPPAARRCSPRPAPGHRHRQLAAQRINALAALRDDASAAGLGFFGDSTLPVQRGST